jgi:tripartite-type tricarboxylate transporter receptor subunit TctC
MKLRGRPRRIRIVVTATVRGGTDEAARTIRPAYPGRS